MAIVYRYTDLADKIVKYIGIVYGKDRTLEQRIKEHSKEQKFQNYNWQIDYIEVDSRTDAEALEGHLIALYETYKYLNVAKNNWGASKFLPTEFEWKKVNLSNFNIVFDRIFKRTGATIVAGMPITCNIDRDGTRYYDCKLMYELPQDWQKLCNKWVKTRLAPSKTNYWGTSYGLKHLLAHDLDIYLTNNQFKHLLLMNGYSPLVVDELNWEYKLRIIKKPSCFIKWCNKYINIKHIPYCRQSRIIIAFAMCLSEHNRKIKEGCDHYYRSEYIKQQVFAIFDDIDNLCKFYKIIMTEQRISKQSQRAVIIYFLKLYKIYESSKQTEDKEIKKQLKELHSWYKQQENNKNYPYFCI